MLATILGTKIRNGTNFFYGVQGTHDILLINALRKENSFWFYIRDSWLLSIKRAGYKPELLI